MANLERQREREKQRNPDARYRKTERALLRGSDWKETGRSLNDLVREALRGGSFARADVRPHTRGSIDRALTIVYGDRQAAGEFWKDSEFKKFLKDQQRQRNAERVEAHHAPAQDAFTLDFRHLRVGSKLYLNTDTNQITGRPVQFVSQPIITPGGMKVVGRKRVETLPLYETATGEYTLENTGQQAILPAELQEVITQMRQQSEWRANWLASGAFEASKKLGFSHDPRLAVNRSNITQANINNMQGTDSEEFMGSLAYQRKLQENSQTPISETAWTTSGTPFEWGNPNQLNELREQIKASPNLSRAVKFGLSGALWLATPSWIIITELGKPAIWLEERLNSQYAMRSRFTRAIHNIVAGGSTIGKMALSGYRIGKALFAGNVPVYAKNNPRVLERIEEAKQKAKESYIDAKAMNDRMVLAQNWIYDNDGKDLYYYQPGERGLGAEKTENADWIDQKFRDTYGITEIAPSPEEALRLRDEYYESAFNRMYDGDTLKAVDDMKTALKYDIQSDPLANPYGSYSWTLYPDRVDAYLTDVAWVTLQKGTILTTDELRRLREYHEDWAVEMLGQMVFDVLNIPLVDDIMDSVVSGSKILLKTVTKGAVKGAEQLPFLGDVVKYLGRMTVPSMANRMTNDVHNILFNLKRGFKTNEDFTKSMKETFFEAAYKASGGESEAREAFEMLRKRPEYANLAYDDFMKITNVMRTVSGEDTQLMLLKASEKQKVVNFLKKEDWGALLDEAFMAFPREVAEKRVRNMTPEFDSLDDVLREQLIEQQLAELRNTTKFAGSMIQKFSFDIGKAYTDYFRVRFGSAIFNDSLSGKLIELLRYTWGEPVGKNLANIVESSIGVARTVRDAWSMAVLSLRPAWIVQNLIDTMFRHAIYGGDIWGDMQTLFFSTQKHLADELGVVPIDFAQSLSRGNLTYMDTVAARLLYEDWKPKFGPVSYYGFERKRLKKEAQKRLAEKTADMAEGSKKKTTQFLGLLDEHLGSTIGALPGAMSDYNTAIEFTIRLRMFHSEYFTLIKQLEPKFTDGLFSKLPTHMQGVGRQLWEMSEGNPAKIRSYAESLLGSYKSGRPDWTFLLPPGIH